MLVSKVELSQAEDKAKTYIVTIFEESFFLVYLQRVQPMYSNLIVNILMK